VIALLGIRPGVDRFVELGKEFAGNRLDRFPAFARFDPGGLRGFGVVRLDRGLQFFGAGKRGGYMLDRERLVVLRPIGQRVGFGARCRRDKNERQQGVAKSD
jgi:hypothetical protein